MSLRDTQLNSPAEMLLRLVFISRFILAFIGCFYVLGALHYGSLVYLIKAALLFGGVVAGSCWLRRRGQLHSCDEAFEAMFNRGGFGEDEELEALIERRDSLESHRGEPGFDPWAVQAVRLEIRNYLRQHPESARFIHGRT